ncbi:hypothetical protein D3C86_1380900 [compost metagenome]
MLITTDLSGMLPIVMAISIGLTERINFNTDFIKTKTTIMIAFIFPAKPGYKISITGSGLPS